MVDVAVEVLAVRLDGSFLFLAAHLSLAFVTTAVAVLSDIDLDSMLVEASVVMQPQVGAVVYRRH